MKNEKIWLSGLFICVGIIVGAYLLQRGFTNMQDSQRVVSVKGLSEKEVPADKVIWPIVFKEANNELATIYAHIEKNNARILDFLLSNGVKKEEITVSPPDITDNQAERYIPDNVRFRYNGASVITVSSNEVEKIRQLIPQIAALIKEGIAIAANRRYENPILYDFSGLNDIKPAMIEEATKNARAAAEKFAQDSDSRLGKIKSAVQGQMTMEDRDENSPHIKALRVVTTVAYFLKD
jgi:hypothetical protein